MPGDREEVAKISEIIASDTHTPTSSTPGFRYTDDESSSLHCGLLRFRGHQDWVFHEAGVGLCSEDGLGREFKVEAVRLIRDRGVSVAQAARDLDVHENVLRKWVKEFAADPGQAFPGHGQMKPEQLEIERLRREVAKLKAERDILKKWPQPTPRRT